MSRRIGFLMAVLAMGLCFASFSSRTVRATALLDQAVVEEVNECFADGWTAEMLEEETLELMGSVKPCRPCQGREWCTCTYPGGYTRISCDPCCYINYAGWITCLD